MHWVARGNDFLTVGHSQKKVYNTLFYWLQEESWYLYTFLGSTIASVK